MASAVPADLQAAIDNAAKQYGLDPAWLVGIWRIESGSSYPNPYVNSSGYGGLFGTGQGSYKWSTQDQANYAASILRRLLNSAGGSLSAALHAYSGGGYSSLPEGSQTGNIVSPNAAGACPPGYKKVLGKCIPEGTPVTQGSAIQGSAIEHVPGVVQAEAAVSALGSVGDLVKWIGGNWDRVLEVLGGSIMLGVGLVILGKRLAGSGPIGELGDALAKIPAPGSSAVQREFRTGEAEGRRQHVRAEGRKSGRERARSELGVGATAGVRRTRTASVAGPGMRERPQGPRPRTAGSLSQGSEIPY